MTRIAILGPKYTFSHQAGLAMYPGSDVEFVDSFNEVFELARRQRVDYGILPIENSSSGSVNEAYLPLLDQDYEPGLSTVRTRIVDEYVLTINHHLLAKAQVPLAEITTLFTHGQPRQQCASFLREHLPHVETKVTDSTARAAQLAADTEGSACIAGDLLLEESGLVALESGIQDLYSNMTRFVSVSALHKTRDVSGLYKTTISIVLPDRPGALVGALKLLSDEEINVISVKTFPVRDTRVMTGFFKDWFALDLLCREDSDEFAAFARLRIANRDLFTAFKILGSYPEFDLVGGIGLTGASPDGGPGLVGNSGELPAELAHMIREGEGGKVEFKASMRIDVATSTVNSALEAAVTKTIAAFLNTDGGALFIGIRDDGTTAGIEEDVASISRADLDGYTSTLFQAVINRMGEEFCQWVRPQYFMRDGRQICVVMVERCPQPAWFNDGRNQERFLVRTGNSSRPLDGRKLTEYVSGHFSDPGQDSTY